MQRVADRRRSCTHLTESYALCGPMKDRLRSWLTPVVIDRIRRGTHDRADADRTLPEAVRPLSASKQLAARVAAHAKSAHRWLTLKSHATCDRASTVLPRGRPRTSRRPRVSGDAGCTRSICYELQAEAIRGGDLDLIAQLRWQHARTCHRRRLSRRKPAAACRTRASRMNSTRKMQLACSQAHPNRPAEAALSSSLV